MIEKPVRVFSVEQDSFPNESHCELPAPPKADIYTQSGQMALGKAMALRKCDLVMLTEVLSVP